MQDAWQPIAIDQGQCLLASIGPLQLYVMHRRDEMRIASKYLPEGEIFEMKASLGPVDRPPDDLDWTRWIVGDADRIQLIPAMPDRSCVVRPELPVKVPTGREAHFFVRVPLWVRVTVPGPTPLTLSEVPSVVLSNTWFGDPLSGELCYSMRTTARREAEEETVVPNRAVVPVRVRNEAPCALDVQRISVGVKHLKVYRGARCLWSNQVNATFRGEDQVSRIDYETNPPRHAGQAELLCDQREPVHESIFRRTFITSLLNVRLF